MKYDIGKNIRKYRKDIGLTQEQLAEAIHATKGCVSNWEQGINRPDVNTLVELCTVLKVTPSVMLDVHISDNECTAFELKLIDAYRKKPDLQRAVNILLGLE